jgi:hypothetical protein
LLTADIIDVADVQRPVLRLYSEAQTDFSALVLLFRKLSTISETVELIAGAAPSAPPLKIFCAVCDGDSGAMKREAGLVVWNQTSDEWDTLAELTFPLSEYSLNETYQWLLGTGRELRPLNPKSLAVLISKSKFGSW